MMLGRARAWIRRTAGPMVRRYRGPAFGLPPHHWGLEVTPTGRLACDGIEIAGLRDRFGSPLHVVLGHRLRANAESFQARSSSGHSQAEVFYSYKTNPVPGVLRRIHDLGLGAEVISEYELWLAFRLGVPPERIIYNGPVKSPSSIREAIERDILLLNINHREEIPLVAAIAREAGRRPRVGVRVTTSWGWSQQFGSSIGNGEALRAVREALATGMLDVVALHSHLGGMVRGTGQIQAHVGEVAEFAETVHRELGLKVEMLDLGGSFATPTVAGITPRDRWLEMKLLARRPPPRPESTLPIADYVRCVLDEVEKHYAGKSAPRVMLEPGRAMTGDTQLLIATVQTLKAAEPPLPWAVLDAGINLAESLRSEYHEILPASRMHAPRDRLYRLAGPICSPGDVVVWAAAAPELQPGDALAIMDAGAYFVPSATSFSFPRPAIVMLDGGEPVLLRRAESNEDLVALDAPIQPSEA